MVASCGAACPGNADPREPPIAPQGRPWRFLSSQPPRSGFVQGCPHPTDTRANANGSCPYPTDARASALDGCPYLMDARTSASDSCPYPTDARANANDLRPHTTDGRASALDGCPHPTDARANALDGCPYPTDAHTNANDSCPIQPSATRSRACGRWRLEALECRRGRCGPAATNRQCPGRKENVVSAHPKRIRRDTAASHMQKVIHERKS